MRPIVGPVPIHFTTSGIRGTYSNCYVQEVTYQRNGVTGDGFHVVRFVHIPTKQGDDRAEHGTKVLLAIVMEALPGEVAVIDPLNLENHYRGDSFEDGILEAVRRWKGKV